MNKFLYKNIVAICAIIAFFMIGIYYVKIATYNIPIMDYWRYINEIGDKIFTNQLTISDLWKPSAGVHRNPFLYLCMIANIKYFGWNTQIEIFLGQFVIVNTTFILYIYYKKFVGENISGIIKQLLFIPVIMTIFNFNQWEIWTLEFSFTFMLRIQLFIIEFILIDKYLHDVDKNKNLLLPISLLAFITIIMIAQGYFVAFVISIVLTIIFKYLLYFKYEKNRYSLYYFVIMFALGLASFIYIFGLKAQGGLGNFLINISKLLLSGNIIKGCIILLGSSVLWSSSEVSTLHILCGSILLALVIISIYLYVKVKMYKKTFLPLMLIVYSFVNFGTIIYSRSSTFGISYLISSRYVCESTLCLTGMSLIFLNYFGSSKTRRPLVNILTIFALATMAIPMMFSVKSELKTAPYRRAYFKNAGTMLENLKGYTDQELSVFQANSPGLVRSGAEIMKKYSIGIFNSNFNENKNLAMGDIVKGLGMYDDGWVEKDFEFKIKTGDDGKIVIKGYYPKDITGNQIISLTTGKSTTEYTIKSSNFSIELKAEPNSIVNVKGNCNFSSAATPPDIRELSFIISEIEGL